MDWLIQNGRVLDQEGELVKRDLRIKNGKIVDMAETLSVQDESVIDAKGHVILPGFVDLHVHLREPGGEKKETIYTGTLAAAKGGFTTIANMPNTRPVPDNQETMKWLMNRIQETAHVRVLPYASITVRQLGKTLTNFDELSETGAFAFTDDGVGVQTAGMMFEAMTEAARIGKSIVAHCEDNSLLYGGAVHKGAFSETSGIPGILSASEAVHIARDVLLAEATGCHYHVCHISTKESVRVVRDAKRAGINVTAEVTPHHLLLCEEDIPGNDANYKMNPPLRGLSDKEALWEGLLDGTIDFIATDHAPHTEAEKSEGMLAAPFGIVGLEIAFPLLYTKCVQEGKLSLKELVDFMTVKPSKSFRLPYGTLEVGSLADITLVNLDEERAVEPSTFLSKGKNTPFAGERLKGWPVATLVEGKIVWKDEQ
ncbi:dihydroorotase [Bacillus coahuilensis p1.1.43]|uniref:Dihydroorotase n=1 Tax=Bacillus coahuilensis p1.1.43 TaxID=1150625 RepID=A0A147K9E8_9BACI|nr:dihydroorotase [Bacillus coahuilensis]KUP07040.1 dihydroorotase [Bacillus coahuilensis p1.1.43]